MAGTIPPSPTSAWMMREGSSAWNSQPLPKMGGTTYGVQARSTLILAARPCNSSEAIRVDFTVNGFSTVPGQDLYVVGSVPELGSWDTTKAIKLNYVSSSQWSGPVFFFASKGAAIQYKYLWKQGGTTTYEGSDSRQYVAILSGVGGWPGVIANAELDPRVRNGALGFIGAVGAFGVVFLVRNFAQNAVRHVELFRQFSVNTGEVVGTGLFLIIVGMVVGAVGSAIAVSRFLDV